MNTRRLDGVKIIATEEAHIIRTIMKKLLVPMIVGLTAMTFLSGCLGLSIGGGATTKPQMATIGQQLVDLQKAKDVGAISDAEFQAQKAKLLAQ